MIPQIIKTALLDKWAIVTKLDKTGTIALKKYYIDETIIEMIANDYLMTELEGCKKGYTYLTGNNTVRVTVEKIEPKE